MKYLKGNGMWQATDADGNERLYRTEADARACEGEGRYGFLLVELATGEDYGEDGRTEYRKLGRVFGADDGKPFPDVASADAAIKVMSDNWPTYEWRGHTYSCDFDFEIIEIRPYTEGMS